VVLEGGETVLVTGQEDSPDGLRIDDPGHGVGHRLEVLMAVGLDVPGVA
jgi:hypothetical protein